MAECVSSHLRSACTHMAGAALYKQLVFTVALPSGNLLGIGCTCKDVLKIHVSLHPFTSSQKLGGVEGFFNSLYLLVYAKSRTLIARTASRKASRSCPRPFTALQCFWTVRGSGPISLKIESSVRTKGTYI